ncbi:hypothetical protein [uncultured Clostridium sp.]|uniref:hypothetical protein n=1 Tax=uncultured Clostridium sp. TaxID=59620 RepID=UPI0028E1AABD|nr:hypothetical protein [uncultured Clostridium sp.]
MKIRGIEKSAKKNNLDYKRISEDNIDFLKKNIALYTKKLKILKVKYDEELLIRIHYHVKVVSSEYLDIQLRSAIDKYNILKNQMLWIIFL